MQNSKPKLKILNFALWFCVFSFALFASSALAGPKHLTILHFNDLHGHLNTECAENKCAGGVARIATLVKQIEKENEAKGWNTIVLFGGDAFVETTISSEFKGEAEIKSLNQIGIDAMAIGNHDFDYSPPILEKRIKEARFSVLAANIKWKCGSPFSTPTAILNKENTIVGIVGLSLKDLYVHTQPMNVADLSFEDPADAANKYYKDIKNTDIQIALTHIGVKNDIELAKKIKGYDAVIGGHTHVKPNEYCRIVKRIPVCQTPARGRYLGRLDFEIEGKKPRLINSKLIAITDETPEDAAVASLVDGYNKNIGKKFDKVIGVSTADFTWSRNGESQIGNFVVDVTRRAANTDIAFYNSWGVRKSVNKGPITLREIAEMLPFENQIVVLNMKGAQIKNVLDYSASHPGKDSLVVSGLTFHIDNKKADDIKVGGAPMDPEKIYSVSTVDFLSQGGGGYAMLKTIESKSINTFIRDAVADYISKERSISPPHVGRISQ